mmetsp:Transcript_54693/g.155715  ORF Transcript_54693/g.155715 Transcript_54693/m.155715 type:complete len:297 (+) Transcript_54693:524-1414(+)
MVPESSLLMNSRQARSGWPCSRSSRRLSSDQAAGSGSASNQGGTSHLSSHSRSLLWTNPHPCRSNASRIRPAPAGQPAVRRNSSRACSSIFPVQSADAPLASQAWSQSPAQDPKVRRAHFWSRQSSAAVAGQNSLKSTVPFSSWSSPLHKLLTSTFMLLFPQNCRNTFSETLKVPSGSSAMRQARTSLPCMRVTCCRNALRASTHRCADFCAHASRWCRFTRGMHSAISVSSQGRCASLWTAGSDWASSHALTSSGILVSALLRCCSSRLTQSLPYARNATSVSLMFPVPSTSQQQ